MAMTKTTDVTYRWLEPDELPKVDPVFEQHRWTPLNEATSRVLVAEDNGKIVGFSVLQLYPHLEPLYVAPEYRGTPIADALAAQMINFLSESDARGFQACADTPFTQRLCEKYGMERITAPVYRMKYKKKD